MSVVGVGDRISLGADHLAHEGLLKRAITSALVDSPRLVKLAAENKIQAYTLPQGVMSQLMRDMAAGRPGLITKTGLHSFVDPRHQGARQSPCTPPDFVEVVQIAGEEWLLFKPLPINVAFLRGTTADEDGNVTMEEEAVLGEMLAMAQATRRQGGIVVVQVKRMARRGTLPAKHVKIPGILVDFVVVDREQRQTYVTYYDPSYSGELRMPVDDMKTLPFGPRKVIVRRGRDGALPRRRLQPRRGRVDRHLDHRGGGGPSRRCDPHQRAGHHRRRAHHRPRLGRRPELRGDDRAAGAVRLLRRRRARPRVPVVRRGRPAGQRQRQPLRRSRSSASAASSTSRRTRAASSSAAR